MLLKIKPEIWNTDNAPPAHVLEMLRFCASSWEPEVRLIGNIRAEDIVKACNSALDALQKTE